MLCDRSPRAEGTRGSSSTAGVRGNEPRAGGGSCPAPPEAVSRVSRAPEGAEPSSARGEQLKLGTTRDESWLQDDVFVTNVT